MAIITTAEYKAYAGITVTTWDTFIGILIDAGTAALERLTGRNFDAATLTQKYTCGPGQTTIQLKSWPINTITSVTYNYAAGGSVTLSSDLYSFNSGTGTLYLRPQLYGRFFQDWQTNSGLATLIDWVPQFVEGNYDYTVVYTTTSAVTNDLKYAMYQWIDAAFAARRRDPALQSESIGSYSYSLGQASSMDAVTVRLFGPFRTGGVV